MEDRLEREEQLVRGPGPEILSVQEELAEDQSLDPETQALIARCMEGTEPLERELKPWEQKDFSAINVTTIMLAAAGFRNAQIAQIQGINQAHISVTLRHPYGRKILHAMMNRQGARVLDIKTRLEEYASDLLDKVANMALQKEVQDLELVAKVGFGILDRAGYGVTQKIESKSTAVTAVASEQTLSRFARALEESRSVDRDIMPVWTPPPAPAEDRSVGTSESVPSAREPEVPLDSGLGPRAGTSLLKLG